MIRPEWVVGGTRAIHAAQIESDDGIAAAQIDNLFSPMTVGSDWSSGSR